MTESTIEHPFGTATAETRQVWEETLDQMIYAFSPQQDYDEIEPSIYHLERTNDLVQTKNSDDYVAIKILKIPKVGITEQDITAYDERKYQWEQLDIQKRQKVLEMFVKYFNCL
ncbi:hypothetical protein V6C59_02620 [Acinetobacter bereziniae]|uniref:hypothetical protein n=1 Tax=Acinetobacter bereziniae TaxID=106648 RepID=UPI002FD950EC